MSNKIRITINKYKSFVIFVSFIIWGVIGVFIYNFLLLNDYVIVSNNNIIISSTDVLENNDNIIIKNNENFINEDFINKSEDHKLFISLIEEGDFSGSISIGEKILENTNSGNLYKEKILLTHAYLNYGNYSFKEKEFFEKSKKIFEEIEEENRDEYYYYYVGYSNEITRNYDLALNNYNKAVELSTNNIFLARVNGQIGHIYSLKGDIDTAYEFYVKSYNYDNYNVNTAILLGSILVKKNNLEDGIKYFEYALKNTNDKFVKSELYFNLSNIYTFVNKENNLETSLIYAEKSIETNPKFFLGYIGKARALFFLNKDFEIAEELIDKALKINPNSSMAYQVLGLIQEAKGNNKKSIEYFNKSLELLDSDIVLMGYDNYMYKGFLHYLLSISYSTDNDIKNALINIKETINTYDKFSLLLLLEAFKTDDNGFFNSLKGNKEYENYKKDMLKFLK